MTVIREDRLITIAAERGMRGVAGSASVVLPCTAEAAGTTWVLTVDPSFEIVDAGAEQEFVFNAPEASGVSTAIEIEGLNTGDPRGMRLPDGSTVAAGAIVSGGYVRLKFKASGLFELLHPAAGTTVKQPLVMCDISGTANALTLTPLTGYAASGDGSAQLFGGVADFDNSGDVTVVITGLNTGDPRNALLPGGASAAIPAGTIQAGEYVEFKYVAATGLFELTCPPSAGAVPQPVINCAITGTPNSLVFTPATGYAVSGGGVAQRFYGKAAATNTAGINAEVIGANTGDARNVLLPDGSAVPVGLIRAGQMIEIKYKESTGLFELIHPPVEAEAAGGLTTYQRIEARRTADNAAKAATLSRRALL